MDTAKRRVRNHPPKVSDETEGHDVGIDEHVDE
jgi:hypothetical protein